MREISVKFDSFGQQYAYLTDDYSIKVGDYCVVKSPTGLKIVEVYQVDCNIGEATKPIVAKVDLVGYELQVEKLARQKELDVAIKKRVKELTETVFLDQLAKKDSVLADLLEQLKKIKE